jgi:hypothetical protein
MSIEFHCDHCARLIRAPDEASGKRGKCPYCHQSVYIPTPPDQIEEIPLAPIDDNDERTRRALEEERKRIETQLRSERRPPAEEGRGSATKGSGGGGSAGGGSSAADAAEARDQVVDYLLLMRNSELVQAESVLAELLKKRQVAREVVDRLAADAVPPAELSEVPLALYQGFLKNLRSQLR